MNARIKDQTNWIKKQTAVADATKSEEEVAGLGKKALKKYKAFLKKAAKQQAAFEKKLAADPDFMNNLNAEIEGIKSEMEKMRAQLK